MEINELKQILDNHKKWLIDNNDGKRADLSSADLRSADLCSADLRYANLRSADLRYANLRSADLRSANLSYANLRSADLSYANLRIANLSSANLRSANLCYADLSYADLSYANLCSAIINNIILPSPTMILLCNWDDVEEGICIDLMNFDRQNHLNPKDFDKWGFENGECPYENHKYQRSANFQENKNLYNPKKRVKSAVKLAEILLDKYCIIKKEE